MINKKINIVCFKAYGDLTIALNVLNLLNNIDNKNINCIVSDHNKILIKALDPYCKYELVNLGATNVPAYYDIRDSSIEDILKSILNAFSACRKFKNEKDSLLLFDNCGFREYFVFFGRKINKIESKYNNIYINYRETLKLYYPNINYWECTKGINKIISIFPESRKSFRNIPTNIIKMLLNLCIDHGYEPRILILDNQSKHYFTNAKTININSFDDSIFHVKNSKAVISADSFATHLASYFKKSVFVLTPYLKTKYWLPVDSLENDYWALFHDENYMKRSIKRFLSNI
jgi:hypothetical protein